jgi:hypothetical protein
MIQVTNGFVTLRVSKGALNSFYASKGFYPVESSELTEAPKLPGGISMPPVDKNDPVEDSAQSQEDVYEEDNDGEEDEEEVDLSEIPLGEMSFEQLRMYADQLDLDHEGLRSKKELRVLIRNHLKK